MSVPPIYVATYSNVEVYECVVGDTALMRRVSDNWINATQILKAAKFPKAHRTRILEKEIQTGVHEKIQGGYGRFQGTWIPLDLARPLAHKYNITDEMAPILTYVPNPYHQLSKKPKANGTPGGSASAKKGESAKKVQQKDTKKRKESMSKGSDHTKKQSAGALPLTDGSFWQPTEPPRFQQPQQHQHQSVVPNGYAPPPQMAPMYGQYGSSQNYPYQQNYPQHQQQQQQQYTQQQQYHQQPQQIQQSLPQQQQSFSQQAPSYGQYPPPPQQQVNYPPYQQHKQKNSNENWSQDDANSTQMDEAMQSDTSISSEHSSMGHDSKNAKAIYTEALVHFFGNETDEVPLALLHPPSNFDFNEPIDEEGHTPLHWASSMASPALIELLVKHGADPLTPSASGLNCVSRAIFFNNSYQKGNFHIIVQLMKNCLYTPDKAGRTPLHYLCESTRSKTSIAQYYLQTILDQLSMGNENLIKIVVNHKDIQGDSALELSDRSGNMTLYDCLKPYAPVEAIVSTPSIIQQTPAQQSRVESPTTAMAYTPGIRSDVGDLTHDIDTTVNDATDSVHGDEGGTLPRPPKLPVHEVAPMLTSMLSSLADAYDSELKSKEEESSHTKTVLEKLQLDLETTESQNREVLAQIDNGMSLQDLEANIKHLEQESQKKTDTMVRIMERSQALRLAKIVLREESSIDPSERMMGGNQIDLSMQLTKLQVNRTRVIDSIISEVTTQNINTKMNNYRKLIGLACDLKAENVDELIDEIEADLLTTVSN